jgi:hypothetical protein
MVTIEPNKPLPLHPTYTGDGRARKFWRLSFHVGRHYVHGLDALGKSVLPTHEREKEGYERRKQLTKPQNHAGPIIRRYNDHVFRIDALRQVDGADATYQMLVKDADGAGVSLVEFMKRSLLRAQIERECYLMPDTTAPSDGTPITVAQAQEQGVRPFIRRISADAVPWWRDSAGQMVECIVLMEDDDGIPYGLLYDAKASREIRFKLGEDGKPTTDFLVEKVAPPKPHSYAACPLVRMRPLFTEFDTDDTGGESQISPLAEQQQMMANLLSLRTEEAFNVTFSQMVAIGVSADQVKGQFIGNNRLLCMPNPQASIEMIGADPAQGAALEGYFNLVRAELYRISGVDPGSSTAAGNSTVPESGIAKAFKHNDLSANLAALAMASEFAENQIMARIFAALGKKPPQAARYPRDFDIPQLSDDLADVTRGLMAGLPPILKRKIVERFASRNFPLNAADQKTLSDQLDEQDAQAAEAAAAPQPPKPAFGS